MSQYSSETPSTSARPSGNLVDLQTVADPPQGLELGNRQHARLLQQLGRRLIVHDRARRVDRLRRGKILHPRGYVDGLAEIVLAFVQHDGQAWPFVDADLQHKIVVAL